MNQSQEPENTMSSLANIVAKNKAIWLGKVMSKIIPPSMFPKDNDMTPANVRKAAKAIAKYRINIQEYSDKTVVCVGKTPVAEFRFTFLGARKPLSL